MDSLVLFGDGRMLDWGEVPLSALGRALARCGDSPACGTRSAARAVGGRGRTGWPVGGKSGALSWCAVWVFAGEACARFGCE